MADSEQASTDAIGPASGKWILADALRSLRTEYRVAVLRAYYLGQTVAHIANREQISESAVKSQLHDALRALRISLQEMGVAG